MKAEAENRTREKKRWTSTGWPLTLDDFRSARSKMPISRQSFNWHQPPGGNRARRIPPSSSPPQQPVNRPFFTSCYTITRIRSHAVSPRQLSNLAISSQFASFSFPSYDIFIGIFIERIERENFSKGMSRVIVLINQLAEIITMFQLENLYDEQFREENVGFGVLVGESF